MIRCCILQCLIWDYTVCKDLSVPILRVITVFLVSDNLKIIDNFIISSQKHNVVGLFVCVQVLWPSQPDRVMSSAVSLLNHTFTGQA